MPVSRIVSSMVPLRVFELIRKRLRLAVLLSVLTILAGPAQVVPGLLSVGVLLENSHVVRVAFDGETFRLVLVHESRPAPGHAVAAPHQHGLASKLLCVVAERSADHPDHCASFATGSAWEELRSQHAKCSSPGGDVFLRWTEFIARTGIEFTIAGLEIRDLGPPASAALGLMLRATVIQV